MADSNTGTSHKLDKSGISCSAKGCYKKKKFTIDGNTSGQKESTEITPNGQGWKKN